MSSSELRFRIGSTRARATTSRLGIGFLLRDRVAALSGLGVALRRWCGRLLQTTEVGRWVRASGPGMRMRVHCGILKRKWKRMGEKGKEVRNDESKRIVYVVVSIEIEYVGSI